MAQVGTKKELLELVEKKDTKVEQPQKWYGYMEIVVCLHIIAVVYTITLVKDVLLDRACRVNLEFGDDICDQLQIRNSSMLQNEERQVQKYVAEVESWSSILENIMIPIGFLVLGSWSDIYGRKLLLYLGMGAFMIRFAILILSLYMTNWTTETIAALSTIPIAFTGYGETTQMALLSYVADTTTVKQKTFRVTLANAFVSISIAIGSLLFGFLSKNGLSLTQLFVTAASINGFCILYSIFFIPNTRSKNPDPVETIKNDEMIRENKSLFANLFNFQNVVETLKVPIRKREGNRRMQLISLLVVMFMFLVSLDYRMVYLFTRYRFQWNREQYAYFHSLCFFLGFLGALGSAFILSRKLGIKDAVIGIISCLSQIGGSLMYALSTAAWMMYTGALVDMMDKIHMSCANSMMFKIVSPDEIGKASAVVGIVRTLGKLGNGPLASLVYRATLSIFPGTFFVVTASTTLVSLIIFVFHWKFGRLSTTTNDKEEQNNP